MKHLLTASLWLLLLLTTKCAIAQDVSKASTTGINNKNDQSPASPTMQGAYSMLMQIVNNGNRDSMLNVQQFKIYTDHHFMYAHALPGDTLAYYGIGTYRFENNKLMEYSFYTSAGGAHQDTFAIDITKMGNGYVQVIKFPADSQGRRYVLTEEYSNVSKPMTSPLDGAWKQTRATWTGADGRTTTDNNPTQFKVFQAGHFMWANTALDSATQKQASSFGYGTFKMNNATEAREIATNSTFRTLLVGVPLTLKLKFMGNDAYQQTIVWPTGKSVEVYERLK